MRWEVTPRSGTRCVKVLARDEAHEPGKRDVTCTHVHECCRLWNIAEEATAQIIDRNGLKTELVRAVVSHMRGDEASSTRHEHARLLAVVEGGVTLADLGGDVGERPRLSEPPVVPLCRAVVPSCRSKVRASRRHQARDGTVMATTRFGRSDTHAMVGVGRYGVSDG